MGFLQTGKLLPLSIIAALIALAALYLFVAVIVDKRRESRRRAALARVAAELGMGFTAEDNALLNQFGGFAFYPHGDWKRATSIMRGTLQGSPVVLFDYHVTLGSYNNRTPVQLTVAAFDLASKPLPVFEAQGGRQNRVTRLLDKVLAEKVIDFPDDPDFTRGFLVVGDDAQTVRRLLNREARSFLARRTEWMFRSDGRWLLMCRLKHRPQPADYRAFVNEALEGMRVLTGARV
jgi:hypothetical protein